MAVFTGHPLYSCRKCRNPVALGDDLLSKSFKAKSGAAYMFSHAMNIVVGAKEDRELITGHFTIANIFCSKCGEEMDFNEQLPQTEFKQEHIREVRLPFQRRPIDKWWEDMLRYFKRTSQISNEENVEAKKSRIEEISLEANVTTKEAEPLIITATRIETVPASTLAATGVFISQQGTLYQHGFTKRLMNLVGILGG
ncbi:Protein yippee-like [Forsythia ovata]|uniref:Protein yippee-like n=1 Tax=Forsythia ovata TaxID=205694 RepID=A0ABD1X9W1_9LAMI